MTTSLRLKDILERGEFVVAPGVFEMISARKSPIVLGSRPCI